MGQQIQSGVGLWTNDIYQRSGPTDGSKQTQECGVPISLTTYTTRHDVFPPDQIEGPQQKREM
uniref:Uncharacterized protein n=1 Tax=Picea glauca TaxID=3330 RepID=A0A101M2J8_PICGL|nr:hypothetical protein ABT39_MTgene3083 [Picea glauca]